MEKPRGYVDSKYLQDITTLVNHVKKRSYEYMRINKGQSVLDVGCGTGIDTIAIAKLVGDTGHVIGIDDDAAMIAQANDRAKKARVLDRVEHRKVNAETLPFAEGEFDSCRSERVFQHLLRPERVLSEMVRVVRHGGWVVVIDTDWGTASIDTTETELERRLMRFKTEHTLNNGYIGRQLHRLFKQQGFVDTSIELFPLCVIDYTFAREMIGLDELESTALSTGVITEGELRRWQKSLNAADAAGTFFSMACQGLMVGRKP
jgi:ubiquinone/menaquinone biosynthesis C-methylase UbiE